MKKSKFKGPKSKITLFLMLVFLLTLTLTVVVSATKILSRNALEGLDAKSLDELYDKIYVEKIEIASRITGTGEYTRGELPENGIPEAGEDYSSTDDYIRTFDTVTYTLNAILRPNLEAEGVDATSAFKGGILKVKATIPDEYDERHFAWEQQSWMENYTISEDGRTICAEYHIPETTQSAPGANKLVFVLNAKGIVTKEGEKEVTPTFEVWMDGNKPDNDESAKESQIITDEQDLYITGKPAFNIKLAEGQVKNKGTYNGVEGYYIDYGIAFELCQGVSYVSDIKGIESPTGTVSADIKLEYSYNGGGSDGWTVVDGANGTELVAYALNYESNDNFWPSSSVKVSTLPQGKGHAWNQVSDSGLMNVTQNGDTLTVTFDNYVIDGHFPTYGRDSAKEGIFTVGHIEVFTPFYDYDSDISYQYQLISRLDKANFSTPSKSNIEYIYENGTLNDLISKDNQCQLEFEKNVGGGLIGTECIVNGNYGLASGGSYYVVVGKSLRVDSHITLGGEGYYGGVERIFSWRSDAFKYKNYSIGEGSALGFEIPSRNNIKVKYGVYKNNKEKGLTTNELVESATFDDFEWYDTLQEIEDLGYTVTSIKVDDPDHTGNSIDRGIYVNFDQIAKEEFVNNCFEFRHKFKVYTDEERTNYVEPTSDPYTMTEYENGVLKHFHSRYTQGQSVLVIPYHVSVIKSVSDTNLEGKPKRTYDVEDRYVNFTVTPNLTTYTPASDDDEYVDLVKVYDYLPKGLTYVEGSSNKEPTSVEVDPKTGITTIIWEYKNWQLNHDAPGYPMIKYKSQMAYSLRNNQQLTNKTVVWTENDWSVESTRTGTYGITIVNLAGIKIVKSTNYTTSDVDGELGFTTDIISASDESLKNVKALDILPYNGDEEGSSFSGGYKFSGITTSDENLNVYYTTIAPEKLQTDAGIGVDETGKLSPDTVDLDNNSAWTLATDLNSIPKNVTAFIYTLDELKSDSIVTINYVLNASGNKPNDVYMSSANLTLDGFTGVVKSNLAIVEIIGKTLDGIVWEDVNEDGIINRKVEITESENKSDDYKVELIEEPLLENVKVILYTTDGNIAKDINGEDVAPVYTDENGYYRFSRLPSAEYIVEFNVGNTYRVTQKLVGDIEEINSKANKENNGVARTDGISGLNVGTINASVHYINCGLIIKPADTSDINIIAYVIILIVSSFEVIYMISILKKDKRKINRQSK